MGRKETYDVERDMRIMEGSSDRHSARLEGQYLGIFPAMEVPTIASKGGKRPRKKGPVLIEDPIILIDLDAKVVGHDENFAHLLLEVIGLHPETADFNVISVMEKVLRALAKAKFKNLAELKYDDKVVYSHPEREYDLKDVLESTREDLLTRKDLEKASARVIEVAEGGLSANIDVDRIHTKFTHDIRIKFDGKIEEEFVNRIINYLEDNLKIERLLER